jgi:hypothetical protein
MRAERTSNSGRSLPWGCCRTTESDGVDRSNSVLRCPFVLIHPEPTRWFLCRVVGSRLSVNPVGTTTTTTTTVTSLCYKESIQVFEVNGSDWDAFVGTRFPLSVTATATATASNVVTVCPEIHKDIPHSHGSVNASASTSVPISTDNDAFLGPLDVTPTPLSSLSLRLRSVVPTLSSSTVEMTERLQPLLLSSLKRQLVGCPLVWSSRDPKVQTELTVDNVLDRTWTFQTQSRTAMQQSLDYGGKLTRLWRTLYQ